MNYRLLLPILCLPALIMWPAPSVRADLILTLDNPNQTVTLGQSTVLHYTGTLTNTFDYDLLGCQCWQQRATRKTPSYAWFSDWAVAAFADWPFTLKAGQTYSGDIFTLTVNGTDALGLYEGQFKATYGDSYDGGPTAQSETLDYSVNVVPEPGSLTGLLTALTGLGAIAWKRK